MRVQLLDYLGMAGWAILLLFAVAPLLRSDPEPTVPTPEPCAIETRALTMCAEMLAECYEPQSLAPGEKST